MLGNRIFSTDMNKHSINNKPFAFKLASIFETVKHIRRNIKLKFNDLRRFLMNYLVAAVNNYIDFGLHF